MKFTTDGNVIEGTPEEIKEMMTLLGAEFPESAKEVKPTPKFKVGDRARLKTDRGALAGFTAGEIVEITKVGRDSVNDVEVYGKSHGTTGYTTSENLEELTYEFSEGYRVKALADGEYGYVKEGDFGTVVDILNDEDDPHFIEVKTADDYDYFRPQDLELIAEEREGVRGFKKGDIVAGYSKLESRELIGIVEDVSSNGLCGVWVGDNYRALDKCKLIAPVESRVDVE